MKPRGIAEVETADAVFGALAHPTRRQIMLSVHYRGECRAGDLAARFDCSWPTTSRHLAVLVESGLLAMEKVGRERVYTANRSMVIDVLQQWAGYFETESV